MLELSLGDQIAGAEIGAQRIWGRSWSKKLVGCCMEVHAKLWGSIFGGGVAGLSVGAR